MFARVKVPPLLPRFLTVAPNRFVPLEDVIAAHLDELFVGLDVLEHHVFRVTRITDLEIDEDVTENLLKSLERELTRRRFEPAVRLEVEESISDDVLDRLVTELDVDTRAVYRVPGPLDLSGLSADRRPGPPAPEVPAFVPSETALPHDGGDASVFTALTERDVLVHHPYDSFTASVQRLLVSAAADPRVLAIKQTLYRTSGDSEIVDALIDAAEAGKQVVVVVEIKARGDERANIAWARKLEQAGCHVVYGFRRPEDALQDGAGRARGAGRVAAPVLPHRHRQLPPEDRAAVRGLRPADGGPDGRRGHHRPVQPPDRATAGGRSTAGCSSPRPACAPG